jgi:hypothetical protein
MSNDSNKVAELEQELKDYAEEYSSLMQRHIAFRMHAVNALGRAAYELERNAELLRLIKSAYESGYSAVVVDFLARCTKTTDDNIEALRKEQSELNMKHL